MGSIVRMQASKHKRKEIARSGIGLYITRRTQAGPRTDADRGHRSTVRIALRLC